MLRRWRGPSFGAPLEAQHKLASVGLALVCALVAANRARGTLARSEAPWTISRDGVGCSKPPAYTPLGGADPYGLR
jgi:hypothetical protein